MIEKSAGQRVSDVRQMTEMAVEKSTRSRWIVASIGLIVVVLGVGFWFASQFQSSAQQEANAKAPAPGPVFAEVTRGTLADEVGFAGLLGPSTQIPVSILPVADTSLTVVTGQPLATGTTVSSGQVLTEVNGRPLFGVQSAFPFYRDMGVGDSGPDVKALQAALVARSYPLNVDGRFGDETDAAVKRWYQDNGYVAATRSALGADEAHPVEEGKPSQPVPTAPALGGYVPVAEILAIPAESAQVVKGVQVGQRLAAEGTPDFVLGSADVVVTITVPASDLGDVVAGDEAMISIDGVDVDAVVGGVRSAGAPETPNELNSEEELEAPEVTFAVIPSTALPVSSGRARVTVVKQIVAQDALIVPVLAVSDRGPERNILTKRQDDGSLIEVPVTVLGTLQGEVAVAPVTDGALRTGDRVRVG